MQPMPQQTPQNMQAFQQLVQQQGFAPPNLINSASQPPMPPQGMQPQGMPPQGMPPQGAAQMSPQQMALMQQIMAQRQQQPGQPAQPQHMTPQQIRFTEQELSALGRMGDTTIAHLTPGEKTVPPELQTPKVLATLKSEYAKKGVSPEQFTVGSPQSSTNPQTGLHEYNFWSSFLPMALGAAGGVFGGPLGAAAGSAVGGVATGEKPTQALESGALAGLGSWGLGSVLGSPNNTVGNLVGNSGATTGAAADSTSAATANGLKMQPQLGSMSLPGGETSSPSFLDSITTKNLSQGAGGALGSYAGQQLFGPGASGTLQNQNFQTNFNKPYTPASQLPSFAQQLGTTSYNGPQANFSNYNPATNNTNAFNFYPTASTTGVG